MQPLEKDLCYLKRLFREPQKDPGKSERALKQIEG